MENKCKVMLLPTDKESNILKHDTTNKLYYYIDKRKVSRTASTQHLYILSDDEIKEGDWFITVDDLDSGICKVQDKTHKYNLDYIKKHPNIYFVFKKVVATTNSDLIKEGIASIDNDFIKSYCDNPVEYVNVEYNRVDYFDDGGIHTTEYDFKPKLSSNGSISIKPVEETWDDIFKTYELYREEFKRTYITPQIWRLEVKPLFIWLKENYEAPKKK